MSRRSSNSGKQRKEVRVWADGCFDMMHYGHANALRQSKELGDKLVVGVHSDKEILHNKGPPVMTEEERYEAVAAVKWVDEIVKDAPYTTDLNFIKKHDIDFVTHGEDISLDANGNDAYAAIKNAGMMRTIKRTEGVSTTDVVGRMLLMSKQHHQRGNSMEAVGPNVHRLSAGARPSSPYTTVSHFLPTSRKIVQFSDGKEPGPNDRITYVDGSYDLFHPGHIAFLRAARADADFLIVGVHDDQTSNKYKGRNYPLMNLHERALSVLACRYVDEVVIGAPYAVTDEMIKSLRINQVVAGSNWRNNPPKEMEDPYAAAKKANKFKTIESPSSLTEEVIVQRIIANRVKFEERNRKKEAKEVKHIAEAASKSKAKA